MAERFEFGGVNHLALVCRDMAATIEFYEGVLGMPLVLTVDLPEGSGQHFFFDAGNDTLLAFFWFPDAPRPVPGSAAPANLPGVGDFTSAIGSMNHVALTVPAASFDAKVELLRSKGVECSEVMNHDDSKWQMSRRNHPGVWLRSVYFWDPNGVLLELAALTRPLVPGDVRHDPRDAAGAPVPLDSLPHRRASHPV